jgi:hypothetical protein
MTIESPHFVASPVGEDWNDTPVLPVNGEVETLVVDLTTTGVADIRQVDMEPKPNPVDFIERQKPTPRSLARPPRKPVDADQFLLQAKALVVANYNDHRDERRTKPLTMETTYIVWFVKTPGAWQAVLGSTTNTARGLRWDVSVDEMTNTASIVVFKKFHHVRISLG